MSDLDKEVWGFEVYKCYVRSIPLFSMACTLKIQHLAFVALWVMSWTYSLCFAHLHWVLAFIVDPLRVFAGALHSYRYDRVRFIPSGGFLAICNCVGMHNVFSSSGLREILLSLVLWEARIHGFDVGILNSLEMMVQCASWMLLLALDILVVCSAANCYVAASELPQLSAASHEGWTSVARSCLRGARHASWRSTCVVAVLTAPLVAVQVFLASKRKRSEDLRVPERENGVHRDFASVLAALEKKKVR